MVLEKRGKVKTAVPCVENKTVIAASVKGRTMKDRLRIKLNDRFANRPLNQMRPQVAANATQAPSGNKTWVHLWNCEHKLTQIDLTKERPPWKVESLDRFRSTRRLRWNFAIAMRFWE